jgi:predicted ATPase/DNA-binding CsgD family transcriptional regulator
MAQHAVDLPAPGDSFVGRSADLAALDALLAKDRARLVTLVGPAGVGKTRLATEVAARTAAAFPDGTVFVALADVREASAVLIAIAGALGMPDLGGLAPIDLVTNHLRDRRMLLVLDNLEQVIEAGTDIARLVARCPETSVLVTSRRPLEVRSERSYFVEPLSLPHPDSRDAEGALGSDAVALMLARVRAIDGRATVTADDVVTVAQICARLDGLPLALELAAARTRTLSLAELLSALESHPVLLTGGRRDAPSRQRTMNDALAWSRGLLGETAAAVLSRLAVAVGGADLDAVAALTADLGLDRVGLLDALDELIAHSLVSRAESAGITRFRLLEVVREFAVTQLPDPDRVTVRAAHAAHFRALAEVTASGFDGPDQAALLDRAQRDSANFAAAVLTAVDAGDGETALRLCLALRFLWYVRGSLAAGRALFGQALGVGGADPVLRATALVESAALARHQGSYADATELLAQAHSAAGADPQVLAAVLLQQGFVAHLVGDFPTARAALEECLALREASNDGLGAARARHHLGFVAASGDQDIDRAWALQSDSLGVFRQLGNHRHVATTLIAMTDLARERGDLDVARDVLDEALDELERLSDLPLLLHALHFAAALAADQDHLNRAARLLGAAEGISMRTGATPWPSVAASSSRWMPRAVRSLGRPRVDALVTAGARLDLGAAVTLARGGDDAAAGALTRREGEIAVLVAEGLTNRAIAERLVLSQRTVDGHVGRILAKLDLASRSQIVAWVLGAADLTPGG